MSGIANSPKGSKGLRWVLGKHYQFLTTTKTSTYLDSGAHRYYFGSGVFVTLPGKTASQWVAKPVGSTKQRPPEGNLNAWTFVQEPTSPALISTVYDTLLKNNEAYTANGHPPLFHRLANPRYTSIEGEEPELNGFSIRASLFTNSLSQQRIHFLGAKMLISPDTTALFEADPKQIRSRCKPFPIEANDYLTQGFLHQATSIEWGTRLFIILVNANGSFQAVPLAAPIESGVLESKYVKSASPTYPAWVLPFVNFRSVAENTGRLPLNPMVSWSANCMGTKCIAMLVQRAELAGTQKLLDLNRATSNVDPDHRIYEVDTGQPVKVRANWSHFGSGEAETVQVDRLGLVELSVNVSLTGPKLEDYQFSLSVSRHEPPNDHAQQRLMVAYAMPALWTNGVQPDDVLELCLELHETDEAIRYRAAQDGVYGLEVPQFGKWIIKKNGTELLSFPSHLLLKGDNPLPFCSLQDMALSEHYTTTLENLDLASLSFLRKSRVRVPTIEFTGGWDSLNKKSATQIDTFVFGAITNTQSEGETAAKAKLIDYLDATYTLNPIRPSLTTTIRARYYDYATQPVMLAPWWGEVLRLPIIRSFIESLYVQLGSSQLGNGKPTGTYGALNQLTIENFVTQFFQAITNYNEANITYDVFDPPPVGWGGYHPSFTWPSLAMLSDANPNFDSANWQSSDLTVNHVAWFLWQCVERARKNTGMFGQVLGDEYNRLRHAVAAFHSSDVGVYSSIEPWILLDIGRAKTLADHLVVRDYPIGQHWFIWCYRNLLRTSEYDQVLTHPNQHYTVWYQDQEYSGLMPEYQVGTDAYPNLQESVIIRWGGQFTYATMPAMTTDSLKPLLHDAISFWNGSIKTSHIALHNQAFDRTEALSEYAPTFDTETTTNQEPILIVNGLRYPTNYWNNPFFKGVLSATANTLVKDNNVAIKRARIAPLWG